MNPSPSPAISSRAMSVANGHPARRLAAPARLRTRGPLRLKPLVELRREADQIRTPCLLPWTDDCDAPAPLGPSRANPLDLRRLPRTEPLPAPTLPGNLGESGRASEVLNADFLLTGARRVVGQPGSRARSPAATPPFRWCRAFEVSLTASPRERLAFVVVACVVARQPGPSRSTAPE
jgi:hypothetical protein